MPNGSTRKTEERTIQQIVEEEEREQIEVEEMDRLVEEGQLERIEQVDLMDLEDQESDMTLQESYILEVAEMDQTQQIEIAAIEAKQKPVGFFKRKDLARILRNAQRAEAIGGIIDSGLLSVIYPKKKVDELLDEALSVLPLPPTLVTLLDKYFPSFMLQLKLFMSSLVLKYLQLDFDFEFEFDIPEVYADEKIDQDIDLGSPGEIEGLQDKVSDLEKILESYKRELDRLLARNLRRANDQCIRSKTHDRVICERFIGMREVWMAIAGLEHDIGMSIKGMPFFK